MDWLEPSFIGIGVDEVAETLLSFVPGEYLELKQGGRGYAHQRRGPSGSQILYDERRPEVHVVLPGEWCGALDESSMRRVLSWIRDKVCNVSRLDLYGDDHKKHATPADVRAAVMEKNELVTHKRTRSFTESMTTEFPGSTATFGRRGSRQYLRVYDKCAESSGANDSIRWELETRDEAAMALLRVLATTDDWGQAWADAVSSFVDFRERWRFADVSACPRVPWFDALISDAHKWSPYSAKAPRTVEEVYTWMRQAIAPSMALLLAAAEGDTDILTGLAVAARGRLRQSHRVMLAQFLARDAA